jgi:hypothetical protein
MAETGTDGITPLPAPTPHQVQAYFDRVGKKRRPEPAQITLEICELAVLLGPGVLAEHARRLTTSGQAYFGAHLIAEALPERLHELEAAAAEPPSSSDRAALHDEYRAGCNEYRVLRRLLRYLADAEPTLFFQQGQFASVRQGVADGSRKSVGIMLMYTGVKRVLEQNGSRVGKGSSSVACRVTAELLSDFGPWGIVTADMVSSRVREEIRRRDTPWRDRWVWKFR